MYRNHLKRLTAVLLSVIAITALPATAATAAQGAAATSLAKAYQDLQRAERALNAYPDAEVRFGPLLRAARAQFEAGVAAAAASGVALYLAITNASAHVPADTAAADAAPALPNPARAPQLTARPSAPANIRLPLRRRARAARLIWV